MSIICTSFGMLLWVVDSAMGREVCFWWNL